MTEGIQKNISILFTLLLLGGCGIGGPAYTHPATRAAAVIDIGFMSFNPATVTIHAGETVEWRNTALIAHTVTDDPKQEKKTGDAISPRGAAAFDSDKIKAGDIYLHTFSVPGTYHYFCEYHEKHGMVGTIVVKK